MEHVAWKILKPFFWYQGSAGINPESYRDDFDKVVSLCSEIDMPLRTYLTAIFYPRLSEFLTNFKVRPNHIHGPWALDKAADWIRCSNKLTMYTMEYEFIHRTKAYIDSLAVSETEYLSNGVIIPPVLADLRKRKVSVVYCCTKPEFRAMYKRLAPDLKDEFFHKTDVFYINNQARISTQLMERIND